MSDQYNIYLKKNYPWHRTITFYDGTPAPIDLTGCTITAWIKLHPEDTATLLDFSITIYDQISLTTRGKYDMDLTAEQIETLISTKCGGKIEHYYHETRIVYSDLTPDYLMEGFVFVRD